jgi:hypothetical protein
MTIVDWAKRLHDPVHVNMTRSIGDTPWLRTTDMQWHVHDNTRPVFRPAPQHTHQTRHAL